jgi:hypothetical protein
MLQKHHELEGIEPLPVEEIDIEEEVEEKKKSRRKSKKHMQKYAPLIFEECYVRNQKAYLNKV